MTTPSQQKASLDVQRKPRTVGDHESQIGPSALLFYQGGVTFPSLQQQLDAAVYALQVQHHCQQQVTAHNHLAIRIA
jgi:hypothetical protein